MKPFIEYWAVRGLFLICVVAVASAPIWSEIAPPIKAGNVSYNDENKDSVGVNAIPGAWASHTTWTSGTISLRSCSGARLWVVATGDTFSTKIDKSWNSVDWTAGDTIRTAKTPAAVTVTYDSLFTVNKGTNNHLVGIPAPFLRVRIVQAEKGNQTLATKVKNIKVSWQCFE